ncbi:MULTISPECIES: pilus assembly protein [unclassified Pseudomonas]|uniref:pilus assembly protein n=1 Tax=unclassified Pseudomonas TaxID=196821 RepID=UPI000D01BDDD|nr:MULTISPECIES: pilus assembly protein [unclassified Pseudomonas]PRN05681.1 pilus assembly protein [Pseudomonas sp. LLC-1]PYG78817.1 P pilus assembly chaperone PapD [Pseudomonas sp. RV120224-01c]PYG82354.1 P pilus assembly chaperone PapD [Pseudomonas sp. RV120224-01b]
MRVPQLLAIVLLSLPLAAAAAPELNIGGLYDYLDGNKSTLLKKVRNGGDSTAFVKVSVVELVYDEAGVAREIDTEGLPLEQRGLVASPARLIVPAKGMQAVRLLYRGSRAEERYFRLRFMPVLPELGDGFAVDEQQAQQYRDSLRAGVNLLAGFGSLLFVRPAQAHYQTPVRREGGLLTVANEGNATVVLDHFRQCRAPQEACEPATKHHLLPGRSRQFEGQKDKVHQFEMLQGDQREQWVAEG